MINEIQIELEKIKDSGEVENDVAESANWLNGIVNWIYLNFTDSPEFKGILYKMISEIIVDIRRSPLGYFLTDSSLESFELNGSAPIINSVRVIVGKGQTSNLPLTLKIDLEYEGPCTLSLKLSTIFGLNLQVETVIYKFKGQVCVVIQDRTIHFCFLESPHQLETTTKISFSSLIQVSGIKYQIPILNSLISNKTIIKKAISMGICFPKFLGQWYRAGPNQPPYPSDPSLIKNPDLLYNWSPKMD